MPYGDLSYSNLPEGCFVPTVIARPNNFEGYVKKGEVLRFGLRVFAENYTLHKVYYFEVAWDGEWTENLTELENHLTFRPVKTLT